MIVADTNIISYLFLPTDYTHKASRLYQEDPEWIAPELWRSEFRNVLALYLRQKAITLADALSMMEEAEGLMAEQEYSPTSISVLTLVTCSVVVHLQARFLYSKNSTTNYNKQQHGIHNPKKIIYKILIIK